MTPRAWEASLDARLLARLARSLRPGLIRLALGQRILARVEQLTARLTLIARARGGATLAVPATPIVHAAWTEVTETELGVAEPAPARVEIVRVRELVEVTRLAPVSPAPHAAPATARPPDAEPRALVPHVATRRVDTPRGESPRPLTHPDAAPRLPDGERPRRGRLGPPLAIQPSSVDKPSSSNAPRPSVQHPSPPPVVTKLGVPAPVARPALVEATADRAPVAVVHAPVRPRESLSPPPTPPSTPVRATVRRHAPPSSHEEHRALPAVRPLPMRAAPAPAPLPHAAPLPAVAPAAPAVRRADATAPRGNAENASGLTPVKRSTPLAPPHLDMRELAEQVQEILERQARHMRARGGAPR